MQFSSLVDRVAGRGAGAWRLHLEALQMRAKGREVILLTVGEPDQAPPEAMIEATVASLRARELGYSPILGAEAVREAIAARFARRTGQSCIAKNVTVVPGAQAG